MSDPNGLIADSLGWKARLQLGFERHAEKTVLANRTQIGPLSVQRPFYPEGDVCHLYLLHPPGGVVGGDELSIDIKVKNHASALITTPGATKFYRNTGRLAQQVQTLTVSAESSLEWFPQENIFFNQTHAQLKTRIELEKTAQFIGWEINCYGRPASNELFDEGQITTSLEIIRDQTPILLDRLRLSSSKDLQSAASLNSYPCFGTLIATQVTPELLKKAREAVAEVNTEQQIGITLLDDVLVARSLGQYAEQVSTTLKLVWAALRPDVLGRNACPPRIWLT